jgi:toluene monooxygenase electron transfer component
MNSVAEHHIRIAGGDVAFACLEGDTVLRAAQRAGLGFPYECNVGSCGNCRFELQEGEVVSAWPEAPAWTDKDRQRQRHLGCQSQPRSDCQIKLRLNDHYAPVHRPQRVGAVLASRRAITHDIHEFRFVLDAPRPFEPGQYALAWLPGVVGPRAWSMSNTAADAWEFQVRRVPGGQGTTALFDALQPGQRIEIDGPYGMAWLRRAAPRDILCLAGGSGLAPMVSIARAAMVEPQLASRQLHFVYGGRTPADLCGRDMLSRLPGWGERLHYHAVVSLPPADWSGARGFVHEAAAQLFGERLRTMETYFAGPPAMANAVQAMLLKAEVPPAQMHFDQFY